ncbi:MAG: DUF4445 domain-containing protein [Bacteroidales bacterium]|nr:DUF4445 domain-containing protein [Bacteroidales bacterium]
MIRLKVYENGKSNVIETTTGDSLLTILRGSGYNIYAPCGGRGTCGKCLVNIKGNGFVQSCTFFPDKDIEIILPGQAEVIILTSQTDYLEDLPFDGGISLGMGTHSVGVAVDIGTTTVVMYFMDMITGETRKIASFLNPQHLYGADVITRIGYCQENVNGLKGLQEVIISAINKELENFVKESGFAADSIEKMVFVGNTTMLHILLGEDPVSIALAPFVPKFTSRQLRTGNETGFNINSGAIIETLPCISAYVGADIVAGVAALKNLHKNYIFLDIGTNGELALARGDKLFTCATAAGPAFEGANISCGMAAVTGAISAFNRQGKYQVIGNTAPEGICGSGIVDIVAYMLLEDIIDETGLLQEPFIIDGMKKLRVLQQDIREIQLAKSAIYSGIIILINHAGLSFNEIDALYLAGGFGNYLNISSAIQIGLLPSELKDRIYPVGNSAGIGSLQYLRSKKFGSKINKVIENSSYIELSDIDEFNMQFALNMNFLKNNYHGKDQTF